MKTYNLDLVITQDDLDELRGFMKEQEYNVDVLTDDDLVIIYRRWITNYMDYQRDWWDELLDADLREDDFLREFLEDKGFFVD